jgi:hypothetical protein
LSHSMRAFAISKAADFLFAFPPSAGPADRQESTVLNSRPLYACDRFTPTLPRPNTALAIGGHTPPDTKGARCED